MGNTHCVADGGCPQRADITIANNTEFNLYLDPSKACGRECHHRGSTWKSEGPVEFLNISFRFNFAGWQITDGKIVQGFEPPHLVKSYDYATFSVSGRDTSAVAPKGKVFYVNPDQDLSIICDWYACGFTNLSNTVSQASITVCGNKTTRVGYGVQKTPWNRILVGEATAEPWKFLIRQR